MNDSATVFDEHWAPQVVNVRSQDGTVRPYTINELPDGGLDDWIKYNREQYKDGKVPRQDDLMVWLVTRCVRDDQGKLVSEDVARGWGPKLRTRVHATCLVANGINDGAIEREGKG